MKCEKCGEEINTFAINLFRHDGSDQYYEYAISEELNCGAITVNTTTNWTGYELSDEERIETIQCPKCKQFPFKDKEIQVYDVVQIICFREGGGEE